MKLKNTYVLTEIGEMIVAVPVGEGVEDSRHVVQLNETAADIWRGLEQGKSLAEIAADLVEDYDGIDLEKAADCVNRAVETLRNAGIVEE